MRSKAYGKPETDVRTMASPVKEETDASIGTLPARAYLANPFVPFQPCGAPTYSVEEGLPKGTLFPGLNLPFHKEENKGTAGTSPLSALQAADFAVTELGEYLDMHADDRETFRKYTALVKTCAERADAYKAVRGPLQQRDTAAIGSYSWIDDPWPWEYGAEDGGKE